VRQAFVSSAQARAGLRLPVDVEQLLAVAIRRA
jgi:hypothetical protein